MNPREAKMMDYLRAVMAHVNGGREKEAFILVQQAILHYPDNPLILSYFGYLQASHDKKYRTGVENCVKAVRVLEKEALAGGKKVHTLVYVNLARAYLAAGRRKDAIDSLQRGFKFDPNRELLKELQKIGIRRKPPVPFLDRSNPINKYLGIMLYSKKAGRTLSRCL